MTAGGRRTGTSRAGAPDGDGRVLAVAASPEHRFSKSPRVAIELLAGLGVRGDAHMGAAVRHRSRVAVDPTQPNLRQVHLIHGELLDDLRAAGFDVAPGELGENVTTRGIDLLGLPTGALMRIGEGALLALTGLRNPCRQIERHRAGLLAQVLRRGAGGRPIRRSGVMAVVLRGGIVRPGDGVAVALPPSPHRPLERV